MPLTTDDAFVLDVHPFGERDVVAVLFSREHGLRRTSARGARARMGRFAGALQTMNEVRATWFEQEGRELVSLRDARAICEIFPSIEMNPGSGAVAAYAADHLRTFAQEHEVNPPLYRLGTHVRDALLAGSPPVLIARYVEVWSLKIAGVFPRVDSCGLCAGPLASFLEAEEIRRDLAGHFLCESCGRAGRPFSRGARLVLREILKRPLPELTPLADAAAELSEIEGICRDVRRGFLGKELVSYSVVKRLIAAE